MSLITIIYIILAVLAAFSISFFQYYYKAKHKNIELAILRFLTVFTLLLLLINPKIKSYKLTETPPTLNVVVDNSSSIKNTNQDSSILKFINNLKKNSDINKNFSVNYYALADNLSQQDSFSFNKSKTNILQSLQTLNSINTNDIAPTILITDGNQTYGDSYEFYKSKQPIYAVVVGDTLQYDDLKINQINVNSYTQLNNKFPVEVLLEYNGNKTVQKIVTITNKNSVVYKKPIEFSKQLNSKKILLNLPASSVGIQNYTCSITTLNNEKNTFNNIKNFSIEVINEEAKILIVSDIKHPDIGMIKRSIETNKQRKVIVEYNLNKNIQLKDYQLVILYQPTEKFKNIFSEIKDKNVNIFIITGTHTNWNYLNNVQDYFSKKNINNTEYYTALFNQNYDAFITEDIGFSNFPPLEDYFGAITFSIPSKILLYQQISGFSSENPLLVTFSDANKKGAVLFGENSWKWRMFVNLEQQSFEKFDTFFNKLIQYLSSNKHFNQLEIDYKPFVFSNSDVIFRAQFFDKTYTFDNSATLFLSVTNTITNKTKTIPFALKNNRYEAILTNLNAGEYIFTITENNHKVSKKGNFTVLKYTIEQQFTTANTNQLKSIAASSNGNFFHISETNKLLSNILSDKRYVTIQKSTEKIVSFIERKWLLGLILLLLSLEWFIRKYRGLI